MEKLKRLNGIFPLYKRKGISSAEALEELKQKLQIISGIKKPLNGYKFSKILKVGHGGTLDPLATGVLLVGLGSSCKKLHDCLTGSKKYRFIAKFGLHYDTFDCTGKILQEKPPGQKIKRDELEAAMKKFVGEGVMQKPPPFSAIHVNGKRAYELARSGETVDPAPKPVSIKKFELISFSEEDNQWEALVECGGGTYIRSLIVDVAKELNELAFMVDLERVEQGAATVERCLHLEDFTELAQIENAFMMK